MVRCGLLCWESTRKRWNKDIHFDDQIWKERELAVGKYLRIRRAHCYACVLDDLPCLIDVQYCQRGTHDLKQLQVVIDYELLWSNIYLKHLYGTPLTLLWVVPLLILLCTQSPSKQRVFPSDVNWRWIACTADLLFVLLPHTHKTEH